MTNTSIKIFKKVYLIKKNKTPSKHFLSENKKEFELKHIFESSLSTKFDNNLEIIFSNQKEFFLFTQKLPSSYFIIKRCNSPLSFQSICNNLNIEYSLTFQKNIDFFLSKK